MSHQRKAREKKRKKKTQGTGQTSKGQGSCRVLFKEKEGSITLNKSRCVFLKQKTGETKKESSKVKLSLTKETLD